MRRGSLVAEVAEAASVLGAGLALPGLAFADVQAQLSAAEKGLILGAEELRPVAELCEIAADARRFFVDEAISGEPGEDGGSRRRPSTPLLTGRADPLVPWERLGHSIRATFDPAGEIRDDVSPELKRLRRERESLSARVRTEVEQLMRDETFAPCCKINSGRFARTGSSCP